MYICLHRRQVDATLNIDIFDSVSLAFATVVLASVALLARPRSARRAATADPVVALRPE